MTGICRLGPSAEAWSSSQHLVRARQGVPAKRLKGTQPNRGVSRYPATTRDSGAFFQRYVRETFQFQEYRYIGQARSLDPYFTIYILEPEPCTVHNLLLCYVISESCLRSDVRMTRVWEYYFVGGVCIQTVSRKAFHTCSHWINIL